MNKKILYWSMGVLVVICGLLFFLFYPSNKNVAVDDTAVTGALSVIYKNNDYGFTFSLPADWQGYSVIQDIWKGTPLTDIPAQTGPKLLIRNPKWTESARYEDIQILIFTISEWNSYTAENFSVSAAPIPASELARNNKYVFALPPRWDFDYSLGYKEAEDILNAKPIHLFNL
jgi:hypothetical protein